MSTHPTPPLAGALAAELRGFADRMTRPYDVDDVLTTFCEASTAMLGTDGCGVMLRDRAGGLRAAFASGADVAAMEDRQAETDDGPCLDAYATARPVTVRDAAADLRWPRYLPTMVASGYRAGLSLPMCVADEPVGVYDLYRREPGACTAEQRDAADVLARVATSYLVAAGNLRRAEILAEQLQGALDSRVVIEQAKGFLAAQWDVPVGEVFPLLRAYARAHNQPLRVVARCLLDGSLDPATLRDRARA